MEGDFHADGGDRQISLFSGEGRQWMETFKTENAGQEGLCFTKFRENITIQGLPLQTLRAGMRLVVEAPFAAASIATGAEVLLEITGEAKLCHDECPLFSAGRACRLAGQSLFAKVLHGGVVRTGDTIIIKENF
jgi:MOSC domain-containing protein YiiM